MGNKFHKNLKIIDGIHTPFAFIYATDADRLAATGFTADDLNKICLVQSTHKSFVLTNHNPVNWVAHAAGGGGDTVIAGDGINVSKSENDATISTYPRAAEITGAATPNEDSNSNAEISPLDSDDNLVQTAVNWDQIKTIHTNRYLAPAGQDPADPNTPLNAVDIKAIADRVVDGDPATIALTYFSNKKATFSILSATYDNAGFYIFTVSPPNSFIGKVHDGIVHVDLTLKIDLNAVLIEKLIGRNRLIKTDDTLEGAGDSSSPLGLSDLERQKGIKTVWYSIKRTYAGSLNENSVDELSIDQETEASDTITDREGNSFDKANLKFVLIERRGESASDYSYLSESTRVGDQFTIIRGSRWLTGTIDHVVLGVGGGDGAMKIYYTPVATLSHGANNRANAPYIGWTTDSGGTDLVVNFDSPGVTPEDIPDKKNFVKDQEFVDAVKAAVTPEPEYTTINAENKTGSNYATATDPVVVQIPTEPTQLFIYLWLEDSNFNANLEKIDSYSKSGHVFVVLNANGTAQFAGIWSSQTKVFMLADGSGQNSKRQSNSKMLRVSVTVKSGSKKGSFSADESVMLRLYPPFVTRDEVQAAVPKQVPSTSLDVPTLYAVRQAIERRLDDYDYLQIFDQTQSSPSSDYSYVPISIPDASGNGDRSVTSGKITIPLVAETSVLRDAANTEVQLNPDKLFQVVGTGEINARISVETGLRVWIGIRFYHIGIYTPAIGNAVNINSPSTHWLQYELYSGTVFVQIPLGILTTDVALGSYNISQAILNGIRMTKVKYELEFKFFPFNNTSARPIGGSANSYGIADTTLTDTGLYNSGTVTIKPFELIRCRITHKQR